MENKYKVDYLPLAKQDLVDIVQYIVNTLHNPNAAERIANQILQKIDTLEDYPYSNHCYRPLNELTHEYRQIIIGHYVAFYWVDELVKTVTIARILYGKREFQGSLV